MQYHEVHAWDAKLVTGYEMQDMTLPKSLSTNIGDGDTKGK